MFKAGLLGTNDGETNELCIAQEVEVGVIVLMAYNSIMYRATCSTGRSYGSDGLQFNYSHTMSRGGSHGSHGLQFNYSHMIESILHKPLCQQCRAFTESELKI